MSTRCETTPISSPSWLSYWKRDRIKILEKQLETSTNKLKDAIMLLERKDIVIAEKDAYIEELRTAFIDATIKAQRGGAR